MSKIPQMFISYSHDSLEHKKWVEALASRIRDASIKVILDEWELRLGSDITLFMERAFRSSDRVLMICTDSYIEKANDPRSGVGFERIIAAAELLADLETIKFIPVVRNVSGGEKTARFLGARFYIDFSDDSEYENNLERLIRELKTPVTKKIKASGKRSLKPKATPGSQSARSDKPDLLQPENFSQAGDNHKDFLSAITSFFSAFKNQFQKSALIVGIVLFFVIFGIYYCFYIKQPTNTESNDARKIVPVDSIAVIPFQSETSETRYLANGLTTDVISRLSKLPNLSVFLYKGKETDPQKIARELEIKSVLTGQFAKNGDVLTINVKLQNIRDNNPLLNEQYNRNVTELLGISQDLVTKITRKLQIELAAEEIEILTRNDTENNEAYRIYWEGLDYLARRKKGDIQIAIGHFTTATKLDPKYALAFVGIADSYNTIASNAFLPPNEAIPKAKAAAIRAIEINPKLAEAHAALGNSLAVYDRDWEEAGREFNRAIELNQNIASVHYYYGLLYLTPLGRGEEAIEELKKAIKLDPTNLPYKANLAGVFMYAGQYNEALEQAQKTNESDPKHWVGQIWLAQIYNVKGMYNEAIATSEILLKDDPTNQLYFRIPGFAYAKLNQRQEAESIIKKLREAGRKDNYVLSYRIASIYAALGDKDSAFRELENSFTEHDWDLHRLKIDPLMASLRNDPRFEEMLKRLNLQK